MNVAVTTADEVRIRADPRRYATAAGVLLTCVATLSAAAITLRGPADPPGLTALARGSIVGVPLAAGLLARRRGLNQHFGTLLIAAGLGYWVVTLAESQGSLPYSVGRVSAWLMEVFLLYLVLSYPSGRLVERRDRAIALAMGAAAATFFLPQALLADHYQVPSPWTSCVEDCPSNAFSVVGSQPDFVESLMRPLGALTLCALMLAAILSLLRRQRDATPLMRSMLMPVVVVGIARLGVLGAAVVARQYTDGSALEVTSWLLALSFPVFALTFLAGFARWQLFAARALESIAARVRNAPDAPTLQSALADAFHDRTLELAFPSRVSPTGWIDADGRQVTLPDAGSGRSSSLVHEREQVLAALVHDAALSQHPVLLDAGAAVAAVALNNQRLAAEAEAANHELRRSRARIVASAERERRRIERDLHDGAQQRLVALRIELDLAADLVTMDPERAAGRLRELSVDVDEALEELRLLAKGVYPSLLTDRGLPDALTPVARRCPVPAVLEVHDVDRYPPEIESAVYFCVLEALQNVAKHAPDARRVVVSVDGGGGALLRFSVRDDGSCPGGAKRSGAGITNMRDRVAAVGGVVDVTSTPGVGTLMQGRVPPATPLLT